MRKRTEKGVGEGKMRRKRGREEIEKKSKRRGKGRGEERRRRKMRKRKGIKKGQRKKRGGGRRKRCGRMASLKSPLYILFVLKKKKKEAREEKDQLKAIPKEMCFPRETPQDPRPQTTESHVLFHSQAPPGDPRSSAACGGQRKWAPCISSPSCRKPGSAPVWMEGRK